MGESKALELGCLPSRKILGCYRIQEVISTVGEDPYHSTCRWGFPFTVSVSCEGGGTPAAVVFLLSSEVYTSGMCHRPQKTT